LLFAARLNAIEAVLRPWDAKFPREPSRRRENTYENQP
jgi:hypothetical protein